MTTNSQNFTTDTAEIREAFTEVSEAFDQWLRDQRAEAWEEGFVDSKSLAYLKNVPDRTDIRHRYHEEETR